MTSPSEPSLSPSSAVPAGLARRVAVPLLWLAGAAALATCFVMVDETEYAVVERFGRIVAVYDRPADRGLHVKLPWPIDVARRFDRRVQLFEPPGREVFTRDKKNVTVDAYVCWRIAEWIGSEVESGGFETSLNARPVMRFYRGVGTAEVAEARLDSRIRSALSTALGRVDLGDLLRVAERSEPPAAGAADGKDGGGDPDGKAADKADEDAQNAVRQEKPARADDDESRGSLAMISERVKDELVRGAGAAESLPDKLGIEIVDVRIRRLGFPSGNQSAVFERMRSERRKIAESYRSAGLAENRMIMSRADRQYNEILARAKADAERVRGEAEAESIGILNEAHAKDPELYRTLRTLDAYKAMLTEKTTLVLSASNQLLKLLTEGVPEPADKSEPASKPDDKSKPDATNKPEATVPPASAEKPQTGAAVRPTPDTPPKSEPRAAP